MKRVWVLENAIPFHALPYEQSSADEKAIEYLLGKADLWEESVVKDLCQALCDGRFEVRAVSSTDELRRQLLASAQPPHAIIFDWETVGFSDAANMEAIRHVLSSTFAYVQVYSNDGDETLQGKLADLSKTFPNRLLPARNKADVAPEALRDAVRAAWTSSLAGEAADDVRAKVHRAVEDLLIDLCSVSKDALDALSTGGKEQLTSLALARVRDGLGPDGIHEPSGAKPKTVNDPAIRRLLSTFYYFFPNDEFVRTGDIVQRKSDGVYAIVITPWCDLERFQKKTSGWLTLVEAIPFSKESLAEEGIPSPVVKGSATASYEKTGSSIIPLASMPAAYRNRETLVDVAVVTHRWQSERITGIEKQLKYPLEKYERVCTLSDTFNTGIVSHLAKTIASVGIPDFPDFESGRLNDLVK